MSPDVKTKDHINLAESKFFLQQTWHERNVETKNCFLVLRSTEQPQKAWVWKKQAVLKEHSLIFKASMGPLFPSQGSRWLRASEIVTLSADLC